MNNQIFLFKGIKLNIFNLGYIVNKIALYFLRNLLKSTHMQKHIKRIHNYFSKRVNIFLR